MKKKEISIKIGTPKEVLWTEVKKVTEIRIDNTEKGLEIDRELVKLAKKIIAEEKKK